MRPLIRQQAETYEANLSRLVDLLSAGNLYTVGQITAAIGCSKPSAHAWIATLRKRGHRVVARKLREGQRGPAPLAYAIVGDES